MRSAWVWVGVVACSSPRPEGLRVMVFNIEYGGDVVDFATIVEGAQAADADVIAINEAWLSTERLAEALGWEHWDHRTDVISRFPLLQTTEADGRYTLVEVEPERVVAVANVHLPSDPYGPFAVEDGATAEEVEALEEEVRLPYLRPYLDVLPALVDAGIPAYLGGDFNAPSHLDWTAEAVGVRPHVAYPVRWPTSVAMADAGFTDTYRDAHPDPVRDEGLTWWAGRPIVARYPDHDDPQDRIDLLFAAGPSETLASEVVGERGPHADIGLSEWGSDHRAVVSTFDATPGDMPVLVTVADRLLVLGQELEVRYHGAAQRVVVVAEGETPAAALAEAPTDDDDGTLTLATTGMAVGAYEVLLVDAADSVLSRYAFWIQGEEDSVLLTTDAATYAVGDPITVSWENGPGNRWDWIGVFAAPASPYDYFLGYVYTESEVAGMAVIDEHARAVTWPLPPGDYVVFYMLNDGYVTAAGAEFSVY